MGTDSGDNGAGRGRRSLAGSFPGGPTGGAHEPRTGRLRGGEWFERRRDAARLEGRASRRRKAILIAVLLSAATALSAGLWAGETNKAEATPPVDATADLRKLIMKERNKIVGELWKMESLESWAR